MKGFEKTTFVIALAVFVTLISLQVGFAANQDSAPEYVSQSQEITIMQNIGVNSTGSSSSLGYMVVNFTGSGSPDTSNIENVTLYNQSNNALFGYDDDGVLNDQWNITGDMGIEVPYQNFTLNLTLNSSVQDGFVADVAVTEVNGTNVINATDLPYTDTESTTVDLSSPRINVSSPLE